MYSKNQSEIKKYFKKYFVYKINLFIFAVYFKLYKLYHHGTTTCR